MSDAGAQRMPVIHERTRELSAAADLRCRTGATAVSLEQRLAKALPTRVGGHNQKRASGLTELDTLALLAVLIRFQQELAQRTPHTHNEPRKPWVYDATL